MVEATIRAAWCLNDYSTAVHVLEGVKEKVDNKKQYQVYVDAAEAIFFAVLLLSPKIAVE